MQNFNEFVAHFNEAIDAQLVLTAPKPLALTGKRNALAADQTTVGGEAQALIELANREADLALIHSEGMTYNGLKAILGSADAPDACKSSKAASTRCLPRLLD